MPRRSPLFLISVRQWAFPHVVVGRTLHGVVHGRFLWTAPPSAIFEPMQISEDVVVTSLGIYNQVCFPARQVVNVSLREPVTLQRTAARKFSNWEHIVGIGWHKWNLLWYGVRIIKIDVWGRAF